MANLNDDRIVVLIDMDCFFCQVEAKLQPKYKGKPLAVVQYNQWQLGGIIAVNYEAREFGVTRHMRGEEAKEKCPSIILASVPCLRGKSDTSRYRNAGREVLNVMKKHCTIIERASVDEAYLDITDIVKERMSKISLQPDTISSCLPNTYIVGYMENGKNDEEERQKGIETWLSDVFKELHDVQSQRLAIAGMIVEEIRADIYNVTGFRCSAGISQNKILAKLACGLHKPNCQTILPATAVSSLYSTLPVKKVRNLGGKFGDIIIESLGCNVMGDLLQYSLNYLQKRFDEKTGLWLYNIARGNDYEPVVTRLVSKSVGACKKFPGKQAIINLDVLQHWIGELAAEVCERLEQDSEENQRRATLLTICFHYYQNRNTISQSRSYALNSYKVEKMTKQCVDIITKSTQCPIAYLGISAGKFVSSKCSESLINFFKTNKSNCNDTSKNSNLETDETNKNKTTSSENHKSADINREIKNSEITKPKLIISNDKSEINSSEKKSMTSVNIVEEKLDEKLSERKPMTSANIDHSPMSQKLNKLLKSCNGQTETCKKRRTSSPSVSHTKTNYNNTLKESFKESFFINAFKSKQHTSTDINDATGISKKSVDFNIKHENDIFESKEVSNESKKEMRRTSDSVYDYSHLASNFTENNNEGFMQYETASKSEDERDKRRSQKSSFLEACQENENQHECIGMKDDDIPIQNKQTNVSETENLDVGSSTVRLQEIFPDLNDIDPQVVSLLPPDLQEEAKLYMKTKNESIKVKNQTNSKIKSGKPKSNVKRKRNEGPLSNYFVRRTSNDFKDGSFMRCMECNQMISVLKFNEHNDFHVAQKLQNNL